MNSEAINKAICIHNTGIETLINNYMKVTGCSINDIQLSEKDEGNGKKSWCVERKSFRDRIPADLDELTSAIINKFPYLDAIEVSDVLDYLVNIGIIAHDTTIDNK